MNSQIEILHSIPGRTRIKWNGVEDSISSIEAKLRSIPGVISALYSPISRSAVLHHSSKALSRKPELISKEYSHSQAQTSSSALLSVSGLAIVASAYATEKLLGLPPFLTGKWANLFTPSALAVMYASRNIISNGIKSWRKPNPDLLTSTALIASILKGSPQSALVIYVMSSISEWLMDFTLNRTRGHIREMMEVKTPHAWLVTEDLQEIKVEADKVKAGDHVAVFQGEKVPFDGTVVSHNAQVDQSSITGEYTHVHVSEGCYVYAGSIVTEGKIGIKVDKIGADLTVNRMIRLIEEAQDNQAPIQTVSERFTNKMVPFSFILAGLILIITRDWNRVLNMLVIDYVCGVKLSTAAAISGAIGKAAQNGILIKGGHIIEKLAKTDTVIFDKTGTVTEGKPVVTEILTVNGFSEEQLLAYAASAEEHSSHPIAEAILAEAKIRGIAIPDHEDESVENYVGKGVSVSIEGRHVIVGSRNFMDDHGIALPGQLQTGVYAAMNGKLMGVIEIEDKIRSGMNRSITQLKRNGIDECIMLTGDYEQAAKKVASRISVDEYIAEAMPQDKANIVRQLKKDYERTIMMVGDGINDAPALAYADIGVTIGSKKTDIAMETADVVIHSDNPMLVSEAINISKETMQIMKQNIAATLIINTGAILLGTFGIIRPVAGAAIHNAATIAAVLNRAKLIFSGGKPNVFQIPNPSFHSRQNEIVGSGTGSRGRALSH
ncbi:heavy metal translocating P-type ATPase [Metabacillus sp. 113a]|uniref:heavy metal translocating P-type ATPase n=1 Tax=Metabacillus sp. 113a TaxID=3404706 RepID=UPI003CF92B93